MPFFVLRIALNSFFIGYKSDNSDIALISLEKLLKKAKN